MNTTETLTTVRDALQIGPSGRPTIFLQGPRPYIHSHFTDSMQRLAEQGPSGTELEEAEMLAGYIEEEVGPAIPGDTLLHKPWLDSMKPYVALDLGRIASAVSKTENLGRIDEDRINLSEFTTVFVAESLVTSALLGRMARKRAGRDMTKVAYASVYLSTEYIAELRRDHSELTVPYFARIVNKLSIQKDALQKRLGIARDLRISHRE
jgi:hypothetical protein